MLDLSKRLKAAAIMAGAEVIPVADDLPKLQFTVDQLSDFWGIAKHFSDIASPKIKTETNRYYPHGSHWTHGNSKPLAPDSKYFAFATLFKKARTRQGLSGSDISRVCDVSRQTVHLWEHGKGVPKRENMRNLAEILGLTADELINAAIEGDNNA